MLEPVPSVVVSRWFDWYCRYALRKHFHRVHLFGKTPFDVTQSTVYVGNHSCFWDALAVNFLISRYRRQQAYCMVDAEQVREHPFFRKIGGIAVERGRPRDAVRAIDFAARMLRQSPCAVVIFPQGKIEPAGQRPLGFERGVDRLLEKAPQARIVQIALHYEFWMEQRPELLMSIELGKSREVSELETALGRQADDLAQHSAARKPGDALLLQGRKSVSHWKRRRRETQ